MKKSILLIALVGLCFVPEFVFAQSLSEARGAIQNEANQLFQILKIILRVIFAVGVVGLVWAYASKNQSAKEYLTHFIIALIIGAIGQLMFFVL